MEQLPQYQPTGISLFCVQILLVARRVRDGELRPGFVLLGRGTRLRKRDFLPQERGKPAPGKISLESVIFIPLFD